MNYLLQILYMCFMMKVKTHFLRLWRIFPYLFNYLPFVAVIDGVLFCVHGRLSPKLN